MSAPLLDRYAEDFERLAAMPAGEREAALAALPLNDEERVLLRRMLDADAEGDDPLARVLGEGAAQLATPRDDRLGSYRLLHELGAGGMGTVFLAERVEGGFTQQVAIKLLRGFPTTSGLHRLRQERQILAGLDHPHIARLLDGGETGDGQPWLALEYIDGLPLPDHAARHAPRLADRLALFGAVLDAVGHAHQRLVVHRDIKPANVLVNAAGEVKLLDFGIARLMDLDTDIQRDTSTRVYSAGYASPEQRDGRAITTATDIYSLGVLLHELVSDAAGSSAATDAELAGIVAKATDEDPARRYASAGEFRDDIERYRAGHPVRAARLTRGYRLRKFIGRHRLGVAAGVFAAVALVLFVWRLEHERSRAVAAEAAASRDAQRARAALTFLTDAFDAAAPGNALSRTVSVRDLLDKASQGIEEAAFDPVVAGSVQRMLGSLYHTLGDHDAALAHYRRGFQDAEPPDDREQALAMASSLDHYANLLGGVDHHEQARIAIDEAARLRERFAPGDAIERAHDLLSMAVWHANTGENLKAIPLFQAVLELPRQGVQLPLDLEAPAAAHLSKLLARDDRCSEAIAVADHGLRLLPTGEAPTPRRQWLLRSRATALRNCGQLVEAESVLRELIAMHESTIGTDGIAMLQLSNELSVTLTAQGRFREAAALLQEMQLAEGLGPFNRAVILSNLATTLGDAGDYPQALHMVEQARALLDEASVDADNHGRRAMARIHARVLALHGQAAQAVAALRELRERSLRIDGEASAEYGNATWQLALAMRRAGQTENVPSLLDEVERLWAQALPSPHRDFALIHRARAALALEAAQTETAARELAQALAILNEVSAAASDVAVVRSEQAAVHVRQNRHDEARGLLQQALPVLREAFVPGQIDRAEAERLAGQLGLPPAS